MKIRKSFTVSLFFTLLILGLLISTQYQTQKIIEQSLAGQSTEDLVAIVKSLSDKRDALKNESELLQDTHTSLLDKSLEGESIKNELAKEKENLKIASGKMDLIGPGIVITLTDNIAIEYSDIINILNELWVSGAEMIAVNDNVILTNSHFYMNYSVTDKIVMMDQQPLSFPIIIKAIGEPNTLEKGLTFPGGIVDNLNTIYFIYPQIEQREEIIIPANNDQEKFFRFIQA